MTSPWQASVTPIAPPASANPDVRFLLYAAAVTGIWSGLLCLVIYGIGRAFGVTFITEAPWGMSQTPWFAPLLVPILFAVLGALAASLLRGRRHARRITWWVGTLIALGSAVGPIVQPSDVSWASRTLLLLMHLVTWALVVPQIARIMGDSEPGMSVDR